MNTIHFARHIRLPVALAGVVTAVVLSAPSWADQSGEPDEPPMSSDTAEEMTDDYRVALSDPALTFPQGVAIPDTPRFPTGEDQKRSTTDGARFEEGYGDLEAADAWRCAWELDMFNALERDDESQAQESAAKLLGYYDLSAVQRFVIDPGHQWYQDVVTAALQGDRSRLTQDLNLGCNPEISGQ